MAYPIQTYDDLLNLIKASGRSFDLEQIEHAYQVAAEAHKEQKRKSGEPYITHPVAAACILVELGMDTPCVVAGLLHDVVEDTDITLEEITKNVWQGNCQFNQRRYQTGQSAFFPPVKSSRRKIFGKCSSPCRRILELLLLNLQTACIICGTIEYMTPQKQRDKALENMGGICPIADRLGIRAVKRRIGRFIFALLRPYGLSRD